MLKKMLHRKERLVITAIAIIHEKGFQGLSTRDLASREGISEGAIFRHFKTKNELIEAILDHFTQYDEALWEAASSKEGTYLDKILSIIQGKLSYYENYPEITSVFQSYGTLVHEDELRENVLRIYSYHPNNFKILLKQAQNAGEINSSIDTEMLTDIIMGIFDRMILKWRAKNYSFSLKDQTISAITLILDRMGNKGWKQQK